MDTAAGLFCEQYEIGQKRRDRSYEAAVAEKGEEGIGT
jgi:hypothetical protein